MPAKPPQSFRGWAVFHADGTNAPIWWTIRPSKTDSIRAYMHDYERKFDCCHGGWREARKKFNAVCRRVVVTAAEGE